MISCCLQDWRLGPHDRSGGSGAGRCRRCTAAVKIFSCHALLSQPRSVWLKPVLACVLRSGIGLLTAGSCGRGVGDLQMLVWVVLVPTCSQHVSAAVRNSVVCLVDHGRTAAVASLAAASLCAMVMHFCWLQLLMRCCSVTVAPYRSLCGTVRHLGVAGSNASILLLRCLSPVLSSPQGMVMSPHCLQLAIMIM